MCQPGSGTVTKGATPRNRAPDRSATTQSAAAAPPLNKAALPDRSILASQLPLPDKRKDPLPVAAAKQPATPPPSSPKAQPPAAQSSRPAVTAPPANAPMQQRLDHFFRTELPPVLQDAKKSHSATYDDKARKAIVAQTAFDLLTRMAQLDPLREQLKQSIRRDPKGLDQSELKDGQFRAKCFQAIKEILDKNSVPKEIRPLFLA